MTGWQFTPWVIPLLLAFSVSLWLVRYAWRRRQIPGATPFMLLSMGVAWWSLTYVVRLSCIDLPAKLIWSKVRYLGIVVVPTSWFAFTVQYTGRRAWLTQTVRRLLVVEPLLVSLAVWTNDWHRLYWSDWGVVTERSLVLWTADYGPLRWVHVAYSYVLLLTALHLLIEALVRSPPSYRGQAGALVVSGIVPLIGDILSSYSWMSIPINLSPMSFTIANAMAAWSIAHYRLFDIVPVARRAVVDGMSNGVVVLDIHDNVVDINRAALDSLGLVEEEAVGRPAVEILAGRPALVEHLRQEGESRAEIAWGEGDARRYYDVQISFLWDRRGHVQGRLVLFHDITDRKQIEAHLRAQTRLSENLVAITRAAIKYTSLEAALQGALNMAVTITEAEHGGLFLLDESGAVSRAVFANEDISPEQWKQVVEQVVSAGLAGWVVRHRRPALIPDVTGDERWLSLPEVDRDVRSALAVPISSGSDVFGVITLAHSQPAHFTTGHAYMMQAASDQVALALRNAQMYDEQRALAARQATLYEALRTVGQHLERDTVVHAAVETIARLTDWPVIFLMLPDETFTRLEVVAASEDVSGPEGRRLSFPISRGITGRAFRTGEVQYVPDVPADGDYCGGVEMLTVRSELAVPLRRGRRMLGVLDVVHDRVNGFDEEDIRLAQSLAEAIALALDNARLYTETRRYAADLSTLYAVASSISRSLILEDVLADTFQAALDGLGFDAGLIALMDESGGRLYLAAERGLPEEAIQLFRETGLVDTLCAHIHAHGEVVVIEDVGQEEVARLRQVAPHTFEAMESLGLRSYSGVPLVYQNRPIGTLSFFAYEPRPISLENRMLQVAIGQQIATAVINARLFRGIADERSRLHAMIESSRDGIALVGMDRSLLVINAQALTFLKLPGQPEDWMGRSVLEVLTILKLTDPQVADLVQGEIDGMEGRDGAAREKEYEIPPRTIHWLNLPVRTGEVLLGRLMVLRDVTEERALERMRNDLVHAMVHDLRNPLTAIFGALSFLEPMVVDRLTPDGHQLWQVARNSTQGMLNLIQAILDISRLESRQMPLEQTLVPLRVVVRRILESQMPVAVQKSLALADEIPADLPPVWVDEGLLERVLQNLVGNAVKFTPEGGMVRVTARLEETEQGRKVTVYVSDTGPGIPPEVRNRLFRRFVTGPQQGRGSGLGLAFCKMVIEAHGERLWLEESSARGTTFAFTLPLPQGLE